MINIEKAKKAFDKYTSSYDMSNKQIYLKYHHTYRVCEQSINICKSLNLNEEDTDIAYLVALLHDIGRFEQVKRFNTFNDANSIDHASFGCKLLFEEGLIREFIEDDKYDEIIRKAVFNHSRYYIEEGLNERELLHAKIIRDADKLDIVFNVIKLGHIKLIDDNREITEEVSKLFFEEKPIKHEYKKTKNDDIIGIMAFGFDLNFNYSYKYYIENNVIDNIYQRLTNKDIFKEYVDMINNYIERKCKNVRN